MSGQVPKPEVEVSGCGARTDGQNRTVGGLEPTPLKKLNGARFATPLRSVVETSAMGRGTIMPVMSL